MNVNFAAGIAMIALGVIIWTGLWYMAGFRRGQRQARLRRRMNDQLVADHFDSLPAALRPESDPHAG